MPAEAGEGKTTVKLETLLPYPSEFLAGRYCSYFLSSKALQYSREPV